MSKKILTILLLIVSATAVFGQNPELIHGKLVNKKTAEPVPFAAIQFQENDQVAFSDEAGNFFFNWSGSSVVSIEIRCLGFETYYGKFVPALLPVSGIEIKMVPVSYDMDEITVLSANNTGLSTSSVIGNAAIEYVQPVSLADVMQLLPGNLSVNPVLKDPQQMAIREIGSDPNSAMGTAIFIDGTPLSNDANMQTFSTSHSGDNFSTVAGSGIDLRQVSTDQIESVEVIRGIPSVTYGDLTSGVVSIKTKAGFAPWEVKLKTDPKIKQATLGKGINLKSRHASLNFNLDYLQSFDDLRSKYTGFNRLTGEIGFSKVVSPSVRPFTFNSKLSFYKTVDDFKTDPDALVANERIMSKDRGFRLNASGKWSSGLKLMTSLDYSFSVAYANQISSEERYRSLSRIEMISTSFTEGENEGIFLPSEQFTNYKIAGKPLFVFGQVTAHKLFSFGKGNINRILYGFDYRLNANYGDGQVYDLKNPPFVSVYNSRSRKYSDIPPLQNYSVYLEDKLTLAFGKTFMDLQAGVRMNNFQSDGVFRSKIGFFAEPRLNARYTFLSAKNNRIFDNLAVNFGIGKTYKSPSLLFLYPDKAYFDLAELSYYSGNPASNLALLDTRIFETINPELKPSENLKLEAGLAFKIGKSGGFITAFHENLTNGFAFVNKYLFLDYKRYETTNISPGSKPDPASLSSVSAIAPVYYRMPVNNQEMQKSGIEFGCDFGKIPSVYTSFTIDGAWLHQKEVMSTTPPEYQPQSGTANQYLYFGIYPAGESKISERFNTNLRMVTQIPRLRMIVSTTLQMLWYDKFYYPEYDETPQKLVLADGSTQPFTQEMKADPEYVRFVILKNSGYYLKEEMPFLPLLNFRLSKEINDKLRLSFYVNNLTNYRPEYEYRRSGSFTRRNPSVYFGAEIKVIL